jgi:hypothetical protein
MYDTVKLKASISIKALFEVMPLNKMIDDNMRTKEMTIQIKRLFTRAIQLQKNMEKLSLESQLIHSTH